MTLYLNNRKHIEERTVFKKMIVAGSKLGIEIFVFTPEDVDRTKNQIYAHFYDIQSMSWSRKWTYFPQMIFDRCRYQPNQRFLQLQRFRHTYPRLTYLNRPIANKWVIHQLLSKNDKIAPHLPDTKLYMQPKDLSDHLSNYPILYLKPKNGTGGRGILRIERLKDGFFFIQGRDHQRRIIASQRVTRSDISQRLRRWELKDRYLIQQGIQLKLKDGRVHDYRLLIQKNGSGEWEVTGCVGRVGPKRSITSNLHGGGKAVSMEELLSIWFDNDLLIDSVRKTSYELAKEVATYVEERYGKLCELALDIAIDSTGHVWLLEINPKPAREVFAKIGEYDTYNKAIIRPLEYALWVHEQKLALKTVSFKKKKQTVLRKQRSRY